MKPTSVVRQPSCLVESSYLPELLKILGLSQYYPNKLGREEVYTLTKYSLAENPLCKPDELPLYFLSNLLSLNHQARWIRVDYERKKSSESEEECWIEENDDTESVSKDIHPLDVMIATLLCCHPIIHQDLVVKLWECKLAIPLVIQESEEQAPKFFLWAMRALVMRWKKIKGKQQFRSEERTIADYPMETVSFIRLDRSEISKSALLNAIILGNNPHDIFFHKDSEGSNNHRQIVEGTVELAWYLPEGNLSPDDSSVQNNFRLDDITAFANLRGDARKYPKQLKLVKYISSHVVIFASAKELSSTVSLVQELLSAGKAVILLLTNKIVEKSDSQLVKDWKKNFYREHELKQISLIKIAGKSQPQIRDEVRRRLKTLKPTTDSKISLENLAEVMHQEGMKVDEYDNDCQRGIEQAEKVLELVRQHSSEERKAKLLPLQSKFWKDWADADKEMVRQKRNTLKEESGTYASKQYAIRANSRQQQLDIIQYGQLSQITQLFIEGLMKDDRKVREYFIKQLKLGLDSLSRSELPKLYAAYSKEMQQIAVWGKSSESENYKRHEINQKLAEIDKQIMAQSFGLEHLLREIGQVYLALTALELKHSNKLETDLYQKLPRSAAELLMGGYPLEIMDGEVSCIPLEWVQAVLKEFIQLLQMQGIKNPRIFVLSATGIQSSGKSTLLNTMFGLQFAVSTGRCTKGIYLQPIKLAPDLQEQLQVDYIFVIDTEGIKSSEQSFGSELEHDNELSTFVIGLSNLTLIKVSGENSIYLQDTLPVSVQAFLRMNQAQLKPKIKIIHRNVDTASIEKLNKQNVALNISLDKHTKIACQNEYQSVRFFSNIIEFDLKKDVKYLGALHKGISNYHPIDTAYSESVNQLKSEIIYNINSTNTSTAYDFLQLIKTLWNSIKKDKFVYDFRNVIEIQSRMQLDIVWNKTIQEFERGISELVSAAYKEINQSPSDIFSTKVADEYEEKISTFLGSTWLIEKEKLEKSFEDLKRQYGNSIKQWESLTLNELDNLRERLRKDSRQHIRNYQDGRKNELVFNEIPTLYNRQIIDKINYFLQSNNSHLSTLSYQDLRQKFEDFWNDLIEKNVPTSFSAPEILIDAENLLRDQYGNIYDLIIARKGNKSLRNCQLKNFYGNEKYYCYVEKSEESIGNSENALWINQALQALKDDLLRSLRQDLYQREKQLKQYDPNYLSCFLAQTNKHFAVTAQAWSKKGVSLTRECQADLFMTLCGYAIRQLEKIDLLWRKSQNPFLKIKQEKEKYWLFF